MSDIFIWIGIAFCIIQSAIFSGLNLAFFSLTRLRLEIEAEAKTSIGTYKVLKMRDDSNFLLTTILWGNVGINVLLTLLTDSVLAGASSFIFSTVLITFFGEIIPQAYFSRNALRMASLLAPLLKLYQIILFPVAKPSAILLNYWLGKESIQYFAEHNLKLFIKKHMEGENNEISHIEGTGAINFFSLDDLNIFEESELLNPLSIIQLPSKNGHIQFPEFILSIDDDFVKKVNRSEEKWVIFTDDKNQPQLALDADGFIRSIILNNSIKHIEAFCHRPIIVNLPNTNLDIIIKELHKNEAAENDHPIKNDIVLLWNNQDKRIITGADILGRLLKGI